MALKRVGIASPNYSSRAGTKVRLVCTHTAEGALTYQSLGAYFQNPSSGVSSHAGIDDTPNEIGIYVDRAMKAWTQANANPYTVSVELCGFASWTTTQWNAHPVMLSNCAQWIAEECAYFNIPIRRLTAQQAQGGSAGICGHVDLGSMGGGHWDPGPSFPMDQVIAQAQGQSPTPTPSTKGKTMITTTPTGKGYFTATYDGAVYAFGDAVYKGGPNKGTSGKSDLPAGRTIVGITACAKDGYWLLSSGGDLYSYGSAQFYGKPDRV
jgi:N-acetyl-anhydromuramyl-L-alanine amidase AmpD